MFKRLFATKWMFAVLLAILAYVVYFSYFTVLRYQTLYASYYDLGIMHQTVFNTYSALKTGDWSRFLEMTNTTGPEQIKRMAIHNDPLLAFLAPFYFINPSPATMLIIQAVVVGLGALAAFKITSILFRKYKDVSLLAFIFSLAYLLYPPLQLANIFEFHAVTLSTSLLLFMFYFWLAKKYWLSFVFFILSILSKEQVPLATMLFGVYTFITTLQNKASVAEKSNERRFALYIFIISLIWFIASVFYIIPLYRGGHHFASIRYSDFGGSPSEIIIGVFTNPQNTLRLVFRDGAFEYLRQLLGPLGFLSLLSPLQLLIAAPELAINLLSKSSNMRNIIYQYTAVITPFIFISAMYGTKIIVGYLLSIISVKNKESTVIKIACLYIFLFSLVFAYQKGPLPFAKSRNIHPIKWPQPQAKDAAFWGRTLRDENLKISSTGQLSPFFTSRRYFYTFSARYRLADYVILRPSEIYNYPEKAELIPVYEKLIIDKNFRLIYQKENFEVYKKISNSNDKL